jgi:hypothetical protein
MLKRVGRWRSLFGRKGEVWYYADTAPGKTADRPHKLTLVLGLSNSLVALVAVALSFSSFKVAQQSLRTNEQGLRISQRAYVSVLRVAYYPDQGKDTGSFVIRIKNYGNTPAYIRSLALQIVAVNSDDWDSRWKDSFFKLTPFVSPLAIISVGLEAGSKEEQDMRVWLGYDWLRGMSRNTVEAAILHCRDIFDDMHELTFGWSMTNTTVMHSTNELAVMQILLAAGYRPQIPATETLEHTAKEMMERISKELDR